MKLNIRSKMLGGFALVLLLTTAVNVYSLVQMNVLAGLTESMFDHPLQVTRAVLRADAGIVRMHRGMKDVVLSTDVAGIEAAGATVAEDEEDVYEQLAIVEGWILGDEGKALIAETIQDFRDWKPIRDEVISLTRAGETAQAAFITKGRGAQHVELLESQMIKLRDYAAAKATGMRDSARATRSRVLATTAVALIAAILVGGVLGYLLSGGIAANISSVVGVAEKLATGDLAQRTGVRSNDEIGVLAHAFNLMADSLSGIVLDLVDRSSRLSSGVTEIASATTQMSAGAESQAQQVVRTSSSMEEMSGSIQEVARNAQATASATEATTTRAREGSAKVQAVLDALEQTNASLQELRQSSEEIDQLVSLITDIATQTNILALNAAIEAAGAGVAGARFDVVAEEIRKLAGRTTESTAQIRVTVAKIQHEVQTAAEQMAQMVTQAEEAGRSLDDIVEGIAAVNDMVAVISGSTSQQADTAGQVADALQLITDVSEQTVQATRETATTVEDLSSLAQEMNATASRFKV